MHTLATVIKGFQSMKATQRKDYLPVLQKILDHITNNTGIERLSLNNATTHQITFLCRANDVVWVVRVLPTFHGLEVKIDGNAAFTPCACLGKQGNDPHCPCEMRRHGMQPTDPWTQEEQAKLNAVLGKMFG